MAQPERGYTAATLHHPTRRSPQITGCPFACGLLVIAAWLIAACSLTAPVGGLQGTNPAVVTETPTFTAPAARSTAELPLDAVRLAEKIIPTEPGITKKPSLAGTPAPTLTQPAPLTAAVQNHPQGMSSDLLLISLGKLIRWDPQTHYGITLAENVSEFSIGQSGKSVALLRRKGVTANGAELFDLDLLDFETKQIQKILQAKPGIARISFSPDGSWLAYHTQESGGRVFVLQPHTPEKIIQLGACVYAPAIPDSCRLIWSPDSKEILWADESGLWLASPAKGYSAILNPGLVEISDPNRKKTQIQANFSSLHWSPQGRFVLLHVTPVKSKVSWDSVLDTRTGRMAQILESYETEANEANLSWLDDGRLAAAQISNPSAGQPAVVRVWTLIPTSDPMLNLYRSFPLDLPVLLADIAIEEQIVLQDSSVCFEWLQPAGANQLFFGANLSASGLQPLAFEMQIDSGKIHPLAEIPQDTLAVVRAPDGLGFLAFGPNYRAVYIGLQTKRMFELPYQVDQAAGYAWLTPMPRR